MPRFTVGEVGRGSLTPPECLTGGLPISRRAPSERLPGPHPTGRPSAAPTAGSETRRTQN